MDIITCTKREFEDWKGGKLLLFQGSTESYKPACAPTKLSFYDKAEAYRHLKHHTNFSVIPFKDMTNEIFNSFCYFTYTKYNSDTPMQHYKEYLTPSNELVSVAVY